VRIAVLSDSHDNIWKLAEAMPRLADADVVLHCGDLCSPFMIRRLGEGLGDTPLHIVWGNNDGDAHALTLVAGGYPSVELHGQTGRLELDGWQAAFNHYPDIARDMALSGQYDLVCYGHDHTAHQEMVGGCLLLNPGDLMGLKGTSSIALVDTGSGKATYVSL
jgi:putative phosphoesterase